MNLTNFMNLAISCSWIVHELFMNKCSWTAHELFKNHSWTVHDHFTGADEEASMTLTSMTLTSIDNLIYCHDTNATSVISQIMPHLSYLRMRLKQSLYHRLSYKKSSYRCAQNQIFYYYFIPMVFMLIKAHWLQLPNDKSMYDHEDSRSMATFLMCKRTQLIKNKWLEWLIGCGCLDRQVAHI